MLIDRLRNGTGIVRDPGGSTGAESTMGDEEKRKRDPYAQLTFWVQLGQINIAYFTECSALTIETETMEYAEGGENTFTHKLPTRTKYGNITLKRGMDESQELYNWYTSNIRGPIVRQHMSIILYDKWQKEVRRWELMSAYPVKWTGPDLRTDTGSVAVETVEFAHSGLMPRNDKDALRAQEARAMLNEALKNSNGWTDSL